MNSAFSDLHYFWYMGGYAAAVWPAYGIVLFILSLQLFIAKQKFSRLRKALYQKYVKSS